MTRPTVHFIAGLPRSGSTLLCNLLGQNPAFHVAGTSGLVDILLKIRDEWETIPEMRATPIEQSARYKSNVLRAAFDGYHWSSFEHYDSRWEEFVHFDKSRTWPGYIEMAEMILGREAKIICCVRDVREVLASLEVLWRKNSAMRQIQAEKDKLGMFQNQNGRIHAWLADDGMVGVAYNRLKDAVHRGYRDRLLFVPYEDLCAFPAKWLRLIYAFIDVDIYRSQHDCSKVKQITQENDAAYNFLGLHDIRPEIKATPSRWQEVLGEAGAPWARLNDLWADKEAAAEREDLEDETMARTHGYGPKRQEPIYAARYSS